jgi:hypothetical protein
MIDDQQKTNLLNFIEIENKASVSIKIIWINLHFYILWIKDYNFKFIYNYYLF